MTVRIKVFLVALLFSLPFWWGTNVLGEKLENFFFWQEINKNPQIFTAQLNLEKELENLRPFRNRNVEDLELGVKSAMSVLIKSDGTSNILFEKEKNKKLPIASLTKLMTALVVLENYDLSKEIKISKEAVEQEEDFGKLEAGKTFPVKHFLYPLLMESSNDAAFALADDYDEMTEEKFVEFMNLEAQKLNLKDTFFVNSSGLDPEKPKTEINYSTATDLVKLTEELLNRPLIWEILSTPKYDLYGPVLTNTNELLEKIPEIIGGKTGYTEEAGECILLVSKAPKNKGLLVNVILGTSDRFGEMEKLINWTEEAYKW